jgi:hypothetical protein
VLQHRACEIRFGSLEGGLRNRDRGDGASSCASISRRSIVAIVCPIATASPMSTNMRSMVPGSFDFTATRLRGASVPEISSVDSTLPTAAFTTGTSTIVASDAAVSGAASAVVEDDPHAATNTDALRMTAKPTTQTGNYSNS